MSAGPSEGLNTSPPAQWQEKTEHQEAWWGTQPCQECNPLGLPQRSTDLPLPLCMNPQCGGTGWTVWASLANSPWTEIIPNLWVGGHDYTLWDGNSMKGEHAYPEELFDVVVSAYHRDGFEPSVSVKHILAMFPDSHLTEEPRQHAVQAAQQVVNHLLDGEKVLVRCQAGLNRASLIAGLAMVGLGYRGDDAVQLLRTRRSPWVLCNQEYATFLSGLSAGSLTLLANS